VSATRGTDAALSRSLMLGAIEARFEVVDGAPCPVECSGAATGRGSAPLHTFVDVDSTSGGCCTRAITSVLRLEVGVIWLSHCQKFRVK